ncbi:MAG: energy transducer TonB, partial [Polaribacter sp.]
KQGVKGKVTGNPNSSKYYGNGGSGSGGNYLLSGRNALSKPTANPNCEEEGTVVVEIYVNKQGKVVKADPCKRGTTNSASCLCEAAKKSALNTKWNPDRDAPTTQKGKIIYRFSLSK